MIKIISFVDSFKHFEEPIKEFQKRLGKKIEFIKLKPSRKKEINEIIEDESKQLENYLKNIKGYKILLYIESEQFFSENFSKLIEEKQAKFGDVVFIIGGAYGVDYKILKNQISQKLSLSKMTFTHIQAIMILFEQIYRSECIKKGSKYHH